MRRIHGVWMMLSDGWMWGVGYVAGKQTFSSKAARASHRSSDVAVNLISIMSATSICAHSDV